MTSLSDSQIRELLSLKDRWVALTTLDPDGFPHSVPMGCFLFEDKVVLGCRDGTQKVKNLERDSRCSLLWENGRGETTLTGVLIRGHGRVVRDDQERLALKAEACRQRGQDAPEKVTPGAVYIEVTPLKTISWNRPARRANGSAK